MTMRVKPPASRAVGVIYVMTGKFFHGWYGYRFKGIMFIPRGKGSACDGKTFCKTLHSEVSLIASGYFNIISQMGLRKDNTPAITYVRPGVADAAHAVL